MKNSFHLILIVLLGAISFAYSQIINVSESIEGKWKMHSIIQQGRDVTEEHNPNQDRYITFYQDSTFRTGGTPAGENTGIYSINTQKSILHLDSDVGPEDDSYWRLRVSNDTMYWTGIGTEWAEQFNLIHIR